MSTRELNEKLREILLRGEFQPRDHENSYWNILWEYGASILQDLWRWLSKIFHITGFGGSEISSWAVSLLSFLKGLFWAVIIGLNIWFAIILFRLVKRKYFSTVERNAETLIPQTEEITSFHVLFQQGRYQEMLAVLRSHLRSAFLSHYKLPYAITDRELTRVLPEKESKKAIFLEVAKMFERGAFAGISLEEEELKGLYQAYERDFSEGLLKTEERKIKR